jgi:DNA-binding FadR family transcriptional regulator
MSAGSLRAARAQNGESRKLGEMLAQQIEDEIIAGNGEVGTVLGSEAALIERYGVSRAVFREAIRVVDHHGVAEMRRGPGGGLVVTEPDLGAVVRAVSLKLRFEKIARNQVLEARNVLEIAGARLAAERINPDGVDRIQSCLDDELQRIKRSRNGRPRGDVPAHEFHLIIADLAENPAMSLFVRTISQILGEQSPRSRSRERLAQEVHHAHVRIADAVMAGDAETAARRMSRHLESVTGYLARR